jgi:hypothetical protein
MLFSLDLFPTLGVAEHRLEVGDVRIMEIDIDRMDLLATLKFILQVAHGLLMYMGFLVVVSFELVEDLLVHLGFPVVVWFE